MKIYYQTGESVSYKHGADMYDINVIRETKYSINDVAGNTSLVNTILEEYDLRDEVCSKKIPIFFGVMNSGFHIPVIDIDGCGDRIKQIPLSADALITPKLLLKSRFPWVFSKYASTLGKCCVIQSSLNNVWVIFDQPQAYYADVSVVMSNMQKIVDADERYTKCGSTRQLNVLRLFPAKGFIPRVLINTCTSPIINEIVDNLVKIWSSTEINDLSVQQIVHSL